LNFDLNLDFLKKASFWDIVESGNVIFKLRKKSFQNPIRSVPDAESQHP